MYMRICPRVIAVAVLASCCCCTSRRVGTIPAQGYLPHADVNCFEGHGATEVIDVHMHHTGETDKADRGAIATYKCMRRCDRREGCTAFTTEKTVFGILNCFLRKNVVLASCEQNARRFTTYTRVQGRRLSSSSTNVLSHNRTN